MEVTMKYIRYYNDKFVLFPKSQNHIDMANSMNLQREDIVSAGFVTMDGHGVYCYDRSTSLEIESKGKEDSPMLRSRVEGTMY